MPRVFVGGSHFNCLEERREDPVERLTKGRVELQGERPEEGLVGHQGQSLVVGLRDRMWVEEVLCLQDNGVKGCNVC